MKIKNTFNNTLNFTILVGGMPNRVSLAPNDEISLNAYGADRRLYTGSTTLSGITLTKTDATVPTTYSFVLTANTLMANQTATAVTVGNTIYVGFSGATTAMLKTGLTASTTFSALGINVTGGNATLISNNANFFLTATTLTGGLTMNDVPALFDNVVPGDVKIVMNQSIVRKVLLASAGNTVANFTNPFQL